MSYYDDYDDEYSSEDDIYYHNYSVDYANQILGGHHAISSCVPLMRRKHRRYSPRLVRVSTLDHMPIVNRHQILPSLHSRPKYGNDIDTWSPPPNLPSLEATSEELERRATGGTQFIPQMPLNNVAPLVINTIPSSENTHRPLTEDELRQVQQQQEAFQQHLLNMERHLLEQAQEQQEQQPPPTASSTSSPRFQPPPTTSSTSSPRFQRQTEVSYHDLERDDDQAQIAELIETDPYFAAAMEDFAHTHGLLHSRRHRTYSDHSSSQHSQHLCKRHRAQYRGDSSRFSSSTSSSSISSLTDVSSELKGSKTDSILFRELHGIRQLMEEFVRGRNNMINPMMPVPWSMNGGQFPMTPGVHYPPVVPEPGYQQSLVPPNRSLPPEPKRLVYQNVVNAVKQVLDRRSPSQRDQPLKPSQIDSKLKYVYTKRPRIPPSTSMQRPPLPPLPQQQGRRRSSQMTTPPIISRGPPSPSKNIPPAPPYETLSNFSSSRLTANKDRNLSYGNRQKDSNIYDTLQSGHYLRLYTNKYN